MTKRRLVAYLSLAVLLIPLIANAGWRTREVKWQLSSQGPNAATTIWVRDTTWNSLGGGLSGTGPDTTNEFSLDDADVPPRGFVAKGVSEVMGAATPFAYNSDTTVVAYLLIQADSSAAPASGVTSLTVLLDGKVGGFGPTTTLSRGWVKADSFVVASSSPADGLITGNESIAIPIHGIGPYGNVLAWPMLRARITAAGTTLSAARIFIRYWKYGN